MKRMEKYLALGLVGMMAMSLTACGGKTSEPAAAPEETPAAEAETETGTETEAPTADASGGGMILSG